MPTYGNENGNPLEDTIGFGVQDNTTPTGDDQPLRFQIHEQINRQVFNWGIGYQVTAAAENPPQAAPRPRAKSKKDGKSFLKDMKEHNDRIENTIT